MGACRFLHGLPPDDVIGTVPENILLQHDSSSVLAMATNTLHNVLCITINLFKNFRLRIAIVSWAWRQPNISKHTSALPPRLVSSCSVKNMFIILHGVTFSHKKISFCATLQQFTPFVYFFYQRVSFDLLLLASALGFGASGAKNL